MPNRQVEYVVSGDKLNLYRSALEKQLGKDWRSRIKWITQDGRVLTLNRMDPQHLANALAFFKDRADGKMTGRLALALVEATHRGMLAPSSYELIRAVSKVLSRYKSDLDERAQRPVLSPVLPEDVDDEYLEWDV